MFAVQFFVNSFSYRLFAKPVATITPFLFTSSFTLKAKAHFSPQNNSITYSTTSFSFIMLHLCHNQKSLQHVWQSLAWQTCKLFDDLVKKVFTISNHDIRDVLAKMLRISNYGEDIGGRNWIVLQACSRRPGKVKSLWSVPSLNKLSSLVLWSLNKHLVKRAGGLRRNHRSSLFSDTVCWTTVWLSCIVWMELPFIIVLEEFVWHRKKHFIATLKDGH